MISQGRGLRSQCSGSRMKGGDRPAACRRPNDAVESLTAGLAGLAGGVEAGKSKPVKPSLRWLLSLTMPRVLDTSMPSNTSCSRLTGPCRMRRSRWQRSERKRKSPPAFATSRMGASLVPCSACTGMDIIMNILFFQIHPSCPCSPIDSGQPCEEATHVCCCFMLPHDLESEPSPVHSKAVYHAAAILFPDLPCV